jgi:hypothetical protein
MRTVLFDLETNGLLADVSVIHCMSVMDLADEKVRRFAPENIQEGVEYLQAAADEGMLVGHNIINYDIPVIQKLFPKFSVDRKKIVDTIVLSRLYFSDLMNRDGDHVKAGKLPSKRVGSHALEAWGYRLGMMKGEYATEFKAKFILQFGKDAWKDGLEWAEYSDEMGLYCDQDVQVTYALYKHLMKIEYDNRAVELEHAARWYCSMMERSGWPFNVGKAVELYASLVTKRDAIRAHMMATFPPLVIERWSEKTGKKLKDKVIEFNPASRDQIAHRLIAKYGWEPKSFTEGGKPQVDETVLSKLDYPEAKVLAEYFLLEKRVGQLAEGNQSWLKLERDGHIHGSINTNGAVTGRCTHSSPNITQVPRVSSEYGPECRELFGVRPGFKQVGADLSGLELRCLAHFMARWDQGTYGDVLLNGDVHTENQKAAGLPTRDNAKTFIYGFLYGAGDEKIGSIIGKGRVAGKAIKEKFLAGLPALGSLKKAVDKAADRGYLIGLDGRRMTVRSKHSALNLLLQGAGALIAKRWLVEVFEEAERRGWKYGWGEEWTLLGWQHDEFQTGVREGLEEEFGKMMVECARRAGEYFNFKCPIDAEFKIGNTWRDCH